MLSRFSIFSQDYVSVELRKYIKIRSKCFNPFINKKSIWMKLKIDLVVRKSKLFKPISSNLGKINKKCKFYQELLQAVVPSTEHFLNFMKNVN